MTTDCGSYNALQSHYKYGYRLVRLHLMRLDVFFEVSRVVIKLDLEALRITCFIVQ